MSGSQEDRGARDDTLCFSHLSTREGGRGEKSSVSLRLDWTVVCAFKPSTLEAETGGSLQFQVSLVYGVRSKTAGLHCETLSQRQEERMAGFGAGV